MIIARSIPYRWAILCWCLGIILVIGPTPESFAQESSRRAEFDGPTQADIEAGLADAESNPELDESTLATIKGAYQQAAQDLATAEQAVADQAQFAAMIKTFEADLQATKESLEKYQSDDQGTPVIPSDATTNEIEVELRQRMSELETAIENQQRLSAEPARRQARLVEIPEKISDSQTKLAEVLDQLQVPKLNGQSATEARARWVSLQSQAEKLRRKIESYKTEQDAYAETTQLPVAQADAQNAKVKHLTRFVEQLRARLTQVRQEEVNELAKETTAEAKHTFPELQEVADENKDLAIQLSATVKDIDAELRIAQKATRDRQRLKSDLDTAEQRVEIVNLSDGMGVILRQDKAKLAKLRLEYPYEHAVDNLVEARVKKFSLEDTKKSFNHPGEAAAQKLKDLQVKAKRRKLLHEPLTKLYQTRKEMLQRQLELQGNLIDALNKRQIAVHDLAKTRDQYANFINEHILWIRSGPPIGQGKPVDFSDALAWLTAPKNWMAAGSCLLTGITNHLPRSLPWVALLLVVLGIQPRVTRGIEEAGLRAEKRSCRDFTPTAAALLRTILKAALWPAIFVVAGKVLEAGDGPTSFTRALSFALTHVGLISIPFELLRQTARRTGLADAHFEWQEAGRRSMKRNLDWLVPAAAPFLLILLMLQHFGQENWENTLGRAALLASLGLSTVVVYRLFRPGGAFFQRSADDNADRAWFMQFGYFSLLLLLGCQAVLIIFALAGYNYTAIELGQVWLRTVAMATGLFLLYRVALRFFLVRRRRLRYAQLVEQREQTRKAAEEAADNSTEKPIDALPIELKTEAGLDITDVSRQARELTGVLFGLVAILLAWQIWQDVLPATKIFDDLKIWPVSTDDYGAWLEWVSLRDVLISSALFLLTFLGVRNIPGMLELLLLNQLPLDAGSRYAVSTIVRYIITVAGVILALGFLKIPWSNYSWLVAAVSVGLGFGLQEIVANFVSGLILLLERPVRVGDVVTIDGTTGVVSRIQMRATTVTNWDNQELVVPNKDLVTGKLMNWTLSSVINRIAIELGVAYGTDPEQVRKIVMEVAHENCDVLNDPEPTVCFSEFGDSSLNFKLRCCVTALSRRFLIIHDLNTKIYYRLQEAGIEIPFPQRDLHLITKNGIKLVDDKVEKPSPN